MLELLRRRNIMIASGKKYIIFADPEVERICIANWSSDGIGVTRADAANVTTLGTLFKANTTIVSFDELVEFSRATTWPNTGTGSNARGAFSSCTSLVSVTPATAQTTIPIASFYGCTSLASFIADNIQVINQNAFYNCSSLSTINLSKVTTIGQGAFYNSGSFELNAPLLTSLGTMAFRGSRITKITSLGSITSIPQDSSGINGGCFNQCRDLTEVTLPNTLTSIGQYGFANCTSLTTINLPQSITTIGREAFSGCTNLSIEVDLPNLTSITYSIFKSTKITKVISLGRITAFPTSTAANGVFNSCKSLIEVTLPSTLTNTGNYTFEQCTALATVKCLATNPPTFNTTPFRNTNNTFKIYVPQGCGATYKATSGWSSYAARIYELDSNGNIPT